MKKTKKIIALGLIAVMAVTALTGCSKGESSGKSEFDKKSEIGVITREDGSGTRGAFVELFGVQEEENGEKVDKTVETAVTTNSTSVMMTTVAGDLYSIGYISLGSLNDTVKAVKIDGTEATVENIKNGSYKISRPFNIATKGDVSEAAQDFIDFIMSADGQAVIEENGYITAADGAEAYKGSMDSGKVVIHGSSSIAPVMEKLKEAYNEKNPDVTIDVQQSDSSSGMTDAIDGTCDIGMASRELKDSEKSEGLTPTVIALDGIAVIVNNDSPVTDLTSSQVKDIFTGVAAIWSDILGE